MVEHRRVPLDRPPLSSTTSPNNNSRQHRCFPLQSSGQLVAAEIVDRLSTVIELCANGGTASVSGHAMLTAKGGKTVGRWGIKVPTRNRSLGQKAEHPLPPPSPYISSHTYLCTPKIFAAIFRRRLRATLLTSPSPSAPSRRRHY